MILRQNPSQCKARSYYLMNNEFPLQPHLIHIAQFYNYCHHNLQILLEQSSDEQLYLHHNTME